MMTHLPTTLIPLIGRAKECQEIAALLQQHRLVTLAAPGGMGKTRLALALAGQLAEQFADGVIFVSLSAGVDRSTFVSALADAFGFRFHREAEPADQLLAYLQSKQPLLILDNLDDAEGDTIAFIVKLALSSCTVLITAPKRLGISGEVVYPLKGIALADARTLFVYTARQVQPDFTLTEANQGGILRLCEMVGGMPLGILLAAAWVEALSLDEIADEIAADMNFLHAEWHDLPPHHHNLKELLRTTWGRLTPAEQALLARLSVFEGGFTRDAARTIADADAEALKTFIGRALLWRDSVTGRYAIHELLRQYGMGQLEQHENDVKTRHAEYFARLVEGQTTRLQNQHQLEAAQALTNEWGNIAAAWQWASSNGHNDILIQMSEPLYILFNMQSKWNAGEAFFRQTAEQLRLRPAPAILQAHIDLRVMHLHILSHDTAEFDQPSLTQLESTVQHTILLDETDAFAHYVYGHVLAICGRFDDSIAMLEKSLALYQRCENTYFIAQVHHLLGYVHTRRNDDQLALFHARQSVAISRSIGDLSSLSMFLINAGSFLMWQGHYTEARQCFEEAMRYGQQYNNWSRVLWAEQCLGSLAFYSGDFAAVEQSAHKVLAMSRHYGYRSGLGFGTQNLYMSKLARGEYEAASLLYRTAEFLTDSERAFGLGLADIGLGELQSACEHSHTVFSTGEQTRKIYALCGAACILARSGDLQEATALLSFVWHYKQRGERFIACIPLFHELHVTLEQRLPPHLFAQHWERGKGLDLLHLLPRLEQQLKNASHRLMAGSQSPDALSSRELEILALIAAGLSNQAIADELVIGINTVKKHITHIYSKLGVNSRTQALLKAQTLGLL